MKKYILFDLDGTLTDPYLGITKSVAYSLKEEGIEAPELEKLKPFIGPPLEESYPKYFHMDHDTTWRAIDKFREYFNEKGKFENEVYEGMEECLKQLSKEYTLYVCTSKPLVFALDIMKHFQLDQYFKEIYGSELNGVRTNKAEVIEYCLKQEHISNEECIMVGDRMHDIIGAHKNNIPCIGVLYGYGSREEFNEWKCDYIVEDLNELIKQIHSIH
jgi:phosphoglycolate phosphatase